MKTQSREQEALVTLIAEALEIADKLELDLVAIRLSEALDLIQDFTPKASIN